jgi:hydrogenase expression/formation protein HypE
MTNNLPEGKLNNNLLKKIIEDINNSSSIKPKIGEDAVEINIENYKEILVSSDPITFEADNIGSYLIDVCSNDIYASGGTPKWLIITCLIPINTSFEEIRKNLSKLNKRAKLHDIDIIGGHTEVTSSVNKIIMSGTIIGVYNKHFTKDLKIRPDQDIILGGLAGVEGSKMISTTIKPNSSETKKLDQKSKHLSLSVKEIAKYALEAGQVVKMHDPTEGGIATAIHEITELGEVGCKIQFKKIKFVESFKETCQKLRLNPLGVISSGCLLIISEQENSNKIIEALKKNKISASIIGKTTKKEKGNIININDKLIKLERFDQDEIIKIFKE